MLGRTVRSAANVRSSPQFIQIRSPHPPFPPQPHEAMVCHDASYPGRKLRPLLECTEVLVHTNKSVLDFFLGIVAISENGTSYSQASMPVPAH
jgi:hypothetical protein